MAKVLIIYSSTDGQTLKISERLQQQLNDAGDECRLLPMSDTRDIDWSTVDKVVVGASIRYGHFKKELTELVARHQQELASRPNSFFCVNLTARKPGKDTPAGNAYMRKFLKTSPWQPQLPEVFAGALLYSRYRLSDRLIIQFIMWLTGGVTDPSQDIEYTDWQKVAAYGEAIRKL